jgi:hypothetical protein
VLDTIPPASTPPLNAPMQPTPELQRFLHRLPTSMSRRLTPEELQAYAKALTPQRSPHWIDFKASVPIPGFGIYVALMVGRERRSPDRLRTEGQLGLAPNLIIASVLFGTVMTGWLSTMLLLEGLALMAGNDTDTWWSVYSSHP